MTTTEEELCPDCGSEHPPLTSEFEASLVETAGKLLLAQVEKLCDEQGIEIPEDGIELSPNELRVLAVDLTYPDEDRIRWDGWNVDTWRVSTILTYSLLNRLKPIALALQAVIDHDGIAIHPDHADVVSKALADANGSLQQLVAWPTNFVHPESDVDLVDMTEASDLDPEQIMEDTDFARWIENEVLVAYDNAYADYGAGQPTPVVVITPFSVWRASCEDVVDHEPVYSD